MIAGECLRVAYLFYTFSSGILEEEAELYISDAFHKAFLEVRSN